MTAVDWHAYFAEREAQDLAEFDEFLRIPSISTMPESAGDVRKAARMGCRPHEESRHSRGRAAGNRRAPA